MPSYLATGSGIGWNDAERLTTPAGDGAFGTVPSPFMGLDGEERERAVACLAALRDRARRDPSFTGEERAFVTAQLASARGGFLRRDALERLASLLERAAIEPEEGADAHDPACSVIASARATSNPPPFEHGGSS